MFLLKSYLFLTILYFPKDRIHLIKMSRLRLAFIVIATNLFIISGLIALFITLKVLLNPLNPILIPISLLSVASLMAADIISDLKSLRKFPP